MIRNKQMASRFAAAVAMTTLMGASVFAESRPSNETRARREDGGRISRDRSGSSASARRNEGSPNRAVPSQSKIEVRGDRNRSTATDRNRNAPGRVERSQPSRTERSQPGRIERSQPRNDNNSRNNNGNWRNDSRSRESNRGNNDRYRDNNRNRSDNGRYSDNNRYRNDSRSSRYGNRDRSYYRGKVHRVYPYGGGYRVWLTGCQYPFFVPAAYYHRDRFRIGLTIGLGGYYNSRGYYDYYDDYANDRYYDVSTSRGEIRGVVESVDYRRETFVVKNAATGSFVTIIMRDRGRDPVRSGDYVELRGDWTRDGVFEAYAVDIVD